MQTEIPDASPDSIPTPESDKTQSEPPTTLIKEIPLQEWEQIQTEGSLTEFLKSHPDAKLKIVAVYAPQKSNKP